MGEGARICTYRVNGRSRWDFCVPVPVGLFCLIPFHVAVGVRSDEDPSRDLEKFLEENEKSKQAKIRN